MSPPEPADPESGIAVAAPIAVSRLLFREHGLWHARMEREFF
jgi:hypothetical protein